ncbi:succinate dehydrogenase/fumarate reductase cytochrome b subunit [Alloprevotella rava]|uniref:Succinate dehydrogenase / fumarate reductase cytochrome b subunit n=1 Tax=Alloprevotella rava TaxID=671218 RepID=A0A7W5UEX4_9BACT|nr:succinate dehydrogenase/fumarate reductase cytochrome b subunit [Alloprevotella rava]MBB3702884.1 succinate dehydrogenase / fumarate reductase cytochrome b subunit [Alloprevotella rava]
MWLTTSSVGRKVIMSVTGIALVLFLTFHACMNVVVLFSGDAYNMICEFLGSNWYAVAGTAVLVGLIALHFIYAAILTLQNLKARGNSRYAVVETPAKVEWASQNMFVLGLIVCLGLLLHLFNFWANMMGAEFYNGGMALVGEFEATDGAGLIQFTFGNPVYAVLYLVWLAALWFHLSHGFWSAIQTLGVNNKVWFNRWKLIGNVYVTLVMLMFAAVVVYFALGCKPICG